MTILIADDHKVFADGVSALLQSRLPSVEKICVASSADEVRMLFLQNDISIAFVDIEFGQDDGRDVAKALGKQYPNCQFVALSSHDEPAIISSALKGAFGGYILKTDSLDTIVECIDKVQSGERFISPNSSVSLLNEAVGVKSKRLVPTLTKREKEVIACIANEMSSKEIAEHLFISEKTVEAHRANLMLKLDAKNAAGLIKRAFEYGLL